jgi:SAM-dependent methyltransferase
MSVRDFYERLPYPRPVDRLVGQRDGYANQVRRAWFHRMWPGRPLEVNQKILIAGCGTAQGARYALRHPESHVTAIDISETSLRHTLQLQRTYRLDNLDVHRLALEDVKQLGCAFDAIVCTGVLHHLASPDIGLRALRDVLEPGGAIHLMVYAPYGRAGIYMMQEYCRMLGIGTSADELRELHALLDVLPREHALADLLRHAKDFREPYAMADALLHPMDRAYTVPEVYAWLARCGLSFGRWVEQAPYLAQCGLVAESPHAARLAALPPRLQHAAVELFRGTMVSHSLIAYRDDCLELSQPIDVRGAGWTAFVPIPMPWTICIREGVPAGSVAVLINRAHTCTDLVLRVDAFEDQLLARIDGERTVADIVEAAPRHAAGERRALRFFERLWQYDQIVFDASPAVG